MTESNQTFIKLKKKKLRNRCLTNRRVESKKKVKHQNFSFDKENVQFCAKPFDSQKANTRAYRFQAFGRCIFKQLNNLLLIAIHTSQRVTPTVSEDSVP